MISEWRPLNNHSQNQPTSAEWIVLNGLPLPYLGKAYCLFLTTFGWYQSAAPWAKLQLIKTNMLLSSKDIWCGFCVTSEAVTLVDVDICTW